LKKAIAASMKKVSIPSGELEYVEKGEGPALILLHGGTGSIEEWKSCLDVFSSQFRVIAYNRRGYGRSTPRYAFPVDYYHEDLDDLWELLKALDVTLPSFFCGFSDGGTLALMFAARYPTALRALVVSGAHIYVEEKTARGLDRVRQHYKRAGQNKGLTNTPQYRSQLAWFDRWLGRNFRPFSIEDDMARITCPTLVVQGTEDEFASSDHARDIAGGISNSQLWLVEGARHWIHGGAHEKVFQDRVLDFFSTYQNASTGVVHERLSHSAL
jgi:pimeloyl-ACP methyl ester carboxylesterase